MELLERVGLDAKFAKRYPWQLSGGQQQRVGVARALATDPPFLLMDEPFSAVDPIVRSQLQDEFLRLQADISKTIVMVTHDIDEALKLGDQVVVLRQGGTLAQAASPAELLAAPRTRSSPTSSDRPAVTGRWASTPATTCCALVRRADDHGGAAGFADAVRNTDGGCWRSTPTRSPIGWVDTDNRARRSASKMATSTSAPPLHRRSDPLRDLLNSALSSPSGRCVVTDESGALIGTATDHDIIDAIRRAKDARSAGLSA